MALIAKEVALKALRVAEAEASTLKVRLLKEKLKLELETMQARQLGLCEALETSPASEEQLLCLRGVGKLADLFLQCCRVARKRGIVCSAKGLDKEDMEAPHEEVAARLSWFLEFSECLFRSLRDLLLLMQDGEESAADFNVLMRLFNGSTQQLRLLHQKAVKRGELEKKTRPVVRTTRKLSAEEDPGLEEHAKRRTREAAPKGMMAGGALKTAMIEFAAEEVYKKYVLKIFPRSGLPDMVLKMKGSPDSDLSSLETLRDAYKGFLASTQNKVDEMRAGGCQEAYIKERAEAWFLESLKKGERPEFYMVYRLRMMTEAMDAEPAAAAIKREVASKTTPTQEALKEDPAELEEVLTILETDLVEVLQIDE